MEPIHADPATISVWAKAIGETRLPWSFTWNDMIKNNAYLVFSSDWPACIDINPIRGLHVAVNRRTPDGFPEGGWIEKNKISMSQAMKAYTVAGAYSSFEENLKGQIKTGQLADIIVFSQDLFTIDPMKTHETKVVLTVFDGKVIYKAFDSRVLGESSESIFSKYSFKMRREVSNPWSSSSTINIAPGFFLMKRFD
jgi:predicted amidohydrolase YtcJ